MTALGKGGSCSKNLTKLFPILIILPFDARVHNLSQWKYLANITVNQERTLFPKTNVGKIKFSLLMLLNFKLFLMNVKKGF